jgi:hypothetical protein
LQRVAMVGKRQRDRAEHNDAKARQVFAALEGGFSV